MKELDFIINGGETRRFHTWPVLREQRVDAHSFHVAMLYSLMAGDAEAGPGISVPGLMMCLTHDLPEWRTGDLPAPAKRSIGGRLGMGAAAFRQEWNDMEGELLAEVGLDWEDKCSPEELRLFKLADSMEGALYCIRERMMGNKLIATPFANFRSYIRELAFGEDQVIAMPQSVERQIINYIDDMWEQANGNG